MKTLREQILARIQKRRRDPDWWLKLWSVLDRNKELYKKLGEENTDAE